MAERRAAGRSTVGSGGGTARSPLRDTRRSRRLLRLRLPPSTPLLLLLLLPLLAGPAASAAATPPGSPASPAAALPTAEHHPANTPAARAPAPRPAPPAATATPPPPPGLTASPPPLLSTGGIESNSSSSSSNPNPSDGSSSTSSSTNSPATGNPSSATGTADAVVASAAELVAFIRNASAVAAALDVASSAGLQQRLELAVAGDILLDGAVWPDTYDWPPPALMGASGGGVTAGGGSSRAGAGGGGISITLILTGVPLPVAAAGGGGGEPEAAAATTAARSAPFSGNRTSTAATLALADPHAASGSSTNSSSAGAPTAAAAACPASAASRRRPRLDLASLTGRLRLAAGSVLVLRDLEVSGSTLGTWVSLESLEFLTESAGASLVLDGVLLRHAGCPDPAHLAPGFRAVPRPPDHPGRQALGPPAAAGLWLQQGAGDGGGGGMVVEAALQPLPGSAAAVADADAAATGGAGAGAGAPNDASSLYTWCTCGSGGSSGAGGGGISNSSSIGAAGAGLDGGGGRVCYSPALQLQDYVIALPDFGQVGGYITVIQNSTLLCDRSVSPSCTQQGATERECLLQLLASLPISAAAQQQQDQPIQLTNNSASAPPAPEDGSSRSGQQQPQPPAGAANTTASAAASSSSSNSQGGHSGEVGGSNGRAATDSATAAAAGGGASGGGRTTLAAAVGGAVGGAGAVVVLAVAAALLRRRRRRQSTYAVDGLREDKRQDVEEAVAAPATPAAVGGSSKTCHAASPRTPARPARSGACAATGSGTGGSARQQVSVQASSAGCGGGGGGESGNGLVSGSNSIADASLSGGMAAAGPRGGALQWQRAVAAPADVRLGVLLGAGSFGRVYRGEWRQRRVAVKVLTHGASETPAIERELQVSLAVRHANVVRTLHFARLDVTRGAAARQQQQAAMPKAADAWADLPDMFPTRPAGGGGGGGAGDSVVLANDLYETWLIQELCDGGALSSSLYGGKFHSAAAGGGVGRGGGGGAPLPNMHDIWSLALDVCRGMRYLHSKGLIHADLKAENVLLLSRGTSSTASDLGASPAAAPASCTGSGSQTAAAVSRDGAAAAAAMCSPAPCRYVAKVADFGLSRCLDGGRTHQTTRNVGTLTHMPPESLSGGHLRLEVDVFAFGVLMWELHTGCRPYAGLTAGEVVHRVVVGGARPAFPRHTPPAWRQLAAACWAQAPEDRPSFEQVEQELVTMGASLISDSGAARVSGASGAATAGDAA